MKVPRQNISGSNRIEKSTAHPVVPERHQVHLIHPSFMICSPKFGEGGVEIHIIKYDYRKLACVC